MAENVNTFCKKMHLNKILHLNQEKIKLLFPFSFDALQFTLDLELEIL